MGKMRYFRLENLEVSVNSVDPGLDGRIILKLITKE
jgi:hypothetical protein